ncbi:hypothetical protein ACKZDW_23240 [Ralstonia syzygii subsp. celebesensis]
MKDNKAAMAVLAHDEDMASTLTAWADKGKYDKLLELWVKGLALDWTAMGQSSGAARRTRLPGYPLPVSGSGSAARLTSRSWTGKAARAGCTPAAHQRIGSLAAEIRLGLQRG